MKNNHGFTLLELVISASIFAVLASMVLVNFRGGDREQSLSLGAQAYVGAFRKAQFWALNGRTWAANGGPAVIPSGGYGVKVDICNASPCKGIVFGDLDGEFDYDNGEEIIGESYILPKDILITNITPQAPIEVMFKPPVPIICINRDCSNTPLTTITLEHAQTGETKNILINQETGQVSLQ
jgi:prepilin-type N-terminal cleavage/methylation domain-containing protein